MNSLGVNDGGGLNVYVESISKELSKDNIVPAVSYTHLTLPTTPYV